MTTRTFADPEDEVRGLLDEARIHMEDAIDVLRQAARTSREEGGPYWLHGQLEAYTIPTLETFASDDNPHQPGTIGGLLSALDDGDGSGLDGAWEEER